MRYHVLATDYDGTLAQFEKVTPDTIEALKRLKASGRKIILVTGRELDELRRLFPEHVLFDKIVAENGALVYSPATLKEKILAERPPEHFIHLLKELKIDPLSIGKVIIATWEPQHLAVLNAIKDSGLEYQVIFNKGAVMVLPPGINKAKGLTAALRELAISAHNTVAIGDAENDNAMLQSAEAAIAVENALPQVKLIADRITIHDNSKGVIELIDQLIDNDLAELDHKLNRHYLTVGQYFDCSLFRISPYGNNILLAGSSCSGKTTFTAAFMEQLIAKQYQFCLIDPEGDYFGFQDVITIGDEHQAPVIEEIIQMLKQTEQNVVICVLAIAYPNRPAFFRELLNDILLLNSSTGHPHFLILDEAHHLLSRDMPDSYFNLPADLTNFFAITTNPELIHPSYLKKVNMVMVMGDMPELILHTAFAAISIEKEIPKNMKLQKGEVVVWTRDQNKISLARTFLPLQMMRRHKKKYAAGDLGYHSFYFRGPAQHLNLKASNLMSFIKIGTDLDQETWMFHLRRNDYSNWFSGSLKDKELAQLTKRIENREKDPEIAKQKIFKLINNRYTGPADLICR